MTSAPDRANAPGRADLLAFSLPDLCDYRAAMASALDEAKADLQLVDGVIAERFGPHGRLALEKAGKAHGSATVEIGHGLKLKAEIGQKVEWDQAKLRAIMATMPWDKANHFFDFKFSMKEKMWTALEPGEFRAKVADARTVTLSPIKVSIERKDAART